MNKPSAQGRTDRVQLGVFALLQVAVMLVAISPESLWIDEFWTAHFGAMKSIKDFYELLIVPSGSQTPLHFLHFYLWGQLGLTGEFLFRLANLPLFLVGQMAVFWALRDYPRVFSALFLALSALHPMVWQYANEARPYIMLFAGSQMVLAYLLRLHAAGVHGRPVEPLFMMLFVVGGILLFGASLLGAFWVFAASVHVLVHHLRRSTWRELLGGLNLLQLGLLLLAVGVLTAYYLSSLLQGAGGSRLSSSSMSTVLFAAYELLGLGGIGPSRLALRSQGVAALAPYLPALAVASGVLLALLACGLHAARKQLGNGPLLWLLALGLFPVLVVVGSGFAMHWRVLGRHLIAALPLLNLLLALGMTVLWQRRTQRGLARALVVLGLLALAYSSINQRFAPEHRKDDYRGAAALAQAALAQGQRVWWAAGVIGAHYYQLPGEWDVMGELTSQHSPLPCSDRPGVQVVINASSACLAAMSWPDLVFLSKPETFDTRGELGAFLKAGAYTVQQELPAFTVWRRSGANVIKLP